MSRPVLRKLGFLGAIASAAVVSAGLVPLAPPAAAQMFSEGYQFLKAVKDGDGDKATEMLNVPGTQVVNTRDLTSGDTALHIMTRQGNVLWVRFLLQRGADPNIRNKQGTTPLQLAVTLNLVDAAEALIDKGAQINVSDDTGETPLIAAVHQRNPAMVRRLLEKGGDPDRNDNSGRSARDYIAVMKSNELLLRELEKADEERAAKGTRKTYGPSF